jgi:tetratricopeptide (TPR) repeat protein
MRRLILVDAPGLDWPLITAFSSVKEPSWFDRIRRSGAHGSLNGFVPAIAESLATTIVSGRMPTEHGVYGPWRIEDEKIRPQHAADATCPAIWDALSAVGRNSLVVDWPGFPALAVSGCWVAPAWFDHGFQEGLGDASLSAELAELRLDADSLNPATLLPFVPNVRALAGRPETALLKAALARHASVQAAATRLMKRTDWSLLLLRFDLIARLAPSFMAHSPPALTDGVAAERWSSVRPAALRLVDLSLARLAELAGEETARLLVSARGTLQGEARPVPGAAADAWHSEQGLIGLSGPEIKRGATTWGANITDILPTAMHLLGLKPPEDLPGRCLSETFDTVPQSPGAAESAALSGKPSPLEPAKPVPLTRPVPEIGTPPERPEPARELARREAMARLQSGDAAGALPLLKPLHRNDPKDRRAQLHLARCLFALGEHGRAADLAQDFLIDGDQEPRAHLILGLIELARRRPDHALMHLFRAEQVGRLSPVIHCRIGEAYLLAERPDEARRGFERALALDDRCAPAHDGMARAWLQAGRDEDAVESALAAIEIDYRMASAHFHLGVALARLARYPESVSAFNQCLELDPSRIEAHQWLAELHRRVTGDLLQASRHQAIVDQRQQSADDAIRLTV